jgi:hypothetical protein
MHHGLRVYSYIGQEQIVTGNAHRAAAETFYAVGRECTIRHYKIIVPWSVSVHCARNKFLRCGMWEYTCIMPGANCCGLAYEVTRNSLSLLAHEVISCQEQIIAFRNMNLHYARKQLRLCIWNHIIPRKNYQVLAHEVPLYPEQIVAS